MDSYSLKISRIKSTIDDIREDIKDMKMMDIEMDLHG